MKRFLPLIAFQVLFLITLFIISSIHIEHINSSAKTALTAENLTTSYELILQQRMADAAEEAHRLTKHQNWIGVAGLVLVGITAIFAWGAWRASERGVSITRKAAQAEYQPYLIALTDSFDVVRYIPFNNNKAINFVGDFNIKNIGRTPARDIEITARIKYYAEGRHFKENGAISNWRFDDLHSQECRTFKLNYALSFPDGDAVHFMKIREMDIFINIIFTDIFNERRSYILHFLIEDMATGAHLQGAKEEKVF